MRRGYHVFVVSERGQKQFFLSRGTLRFLTGLALFLALFTFANGIFLGVFLHTLRRLRALEEENRVLHAENAKVQELAEEVRALSEFRKQIAAMLGVDQAPHPLSLEELYHYASEVSRGAGAPMPPLPVPQKRPSPAGESPILREAARLGQKIPQGPPVQGWVSRGYSLEHQGLDIVAAQGTPVVATADGVVLETRFDRILGNTVVLDHGNFRTLYGHLSRIAVSIGQRVQRGDVIGFVGSSGQSTGPHLHYAILDRSGRSLDPTPYVFPAE